MWVVNSFLYSLWVVLDSNVGHLLKLKRKEII